MTNLFSDWNVNRIANLYFREANPNNKVCERYYSLSDIGVIKGLLKKNRCGHEFLYSNRQKTIESSRQVRNEEKFYSIFRRRFKSISYLFQDFLWKSKTWDNKNLEEFLNSFKPDIIFFPCFYTRYTHQVLWRIHEKTNAKVVLFHADDYLSVCKNRNGVFELLKKNIIRKTVLHSIQEAHLNYCISPKQMQEYESASKRNMKILYKGHDFSMSKPEYIRKHTRQIKLVYIGSIHYGRWKTLGMLARAIKTTNNEEFSFNLEIYSQYFPSQNEMEYMEVEGCSTFMGSLTSDEVKHKLSEADIVMHVESFDLIEKLLTRLSFSTKIVDCLHSGRTIMAIGWNEAASIDYFISNDIGIVATSEEEIADKLMSIRNNPQLLKIYSDKSWYFGLENHQVDVIRCNFYDDLYSILH